MNCTIGAETRHLFDKHNTLKAIVRYLPWCLLKVSVLYFTFDQTKCTYICNSLQVTKPVPLFHWHSIGWFFFLLLLLFISFRTPPISFIFIFSILLNVSLNCLYIFHHHAERTHIEWYWVWNELKMLSFWELK